MPSLLLLVLCLLPVRTPATAPVEGPWRAWLHSPGGDLPFGLELSRAGDALLATIVNGGERIAVPLVAARGDGALELGFPHYDARIVASVSDDGRRLDGEWVKRRGADAWARLPFAAQAGAAPRFPAHAPGEEGALGRAPAGGLGPADAAPPIDGTWRIDFASGEAPAVGVLASADGYGVEGTILTTLGDYRTLAGRWEAGRLRLSTFDGAHAFLFDARLQPDGSLHGDFWSSDSWHERWTARRDPLAALPDGFAATRATDATPDWSAYAFPDLDGITRTLADPLFAGRARLVQVFGSWCPNCHDASDLLVELDRAYRARGLSIVGLAFEHTGDRRRDTEQVRRYAARHGVTYPLLVAGLSDKAAASAALPVLDRVRAFPTTLFLDASGAVRAIHSGFAGPATGAHHDALRAEFVERIEALLAE